VRRRWSIKERSSSEGAHQKGADDGDARMESGTEEGLRWTPGRWGKRVRCSGLDGRDERRGGRGDRSAGGGSLLKGWRGTAERGGPVAGTPCGTGAGVGPGSDQRVAPLFRQWRASGPDWWRDRECGAGRMWAGPEKRGVDRTPDEQ
jgi:hypothetical protein